LKPAEKAALDTLFRRLTVHPLDAAVIARAIELRQKSKMRLADAIIAATALVQSLPLVTRNLGDFKRVVGLKAIDPFNAETLDLNEPTSGKIPDA
jgi:predicted nucleic acid-binding protein